MRRREPGAGGGPCSRQALTAHRCFCFVLELTEGQEEDRLAAVGRGARGRGVFPPLSPRQNLKPQSPYIHQVFEKVCKEQMPPYGLQLRSNVPTTMFRSHTAQRLSVGIMRALTRLLQQRRRYHADSRQLDHTHTSGCKLQGVWGSVLGVTFALVLLVDICSHNARAISHGFQGLHVVRGLEFVLL